MTLIKEYFCDEKPTRVDLLEAIDIANNENCLVQLTWYYNGWHKTFVRKGMTIGECEQNLTQKYWM